MTKAACGIHDYCTSQSCWSSACESCQSGKGPGAGSCYMSAPFGSTCQTIWSSTASWEGNYFFTVAFSTGRVQNTKDDTLESVQFLCVYK